MLFSSPIFFAFFAVYFLLHLATPRQYRVYLIILGSSVFYGWWLWQYVWLPYLLLAIAYLGVVAIDRTPEPAARRRRLTVTILLLFAPLLIVKYTDFLYHDVFGALIGGERGKLLNLPLPLGISFITFTLTAYVVDIYSGRFPPDKNLPRVTAYLLFFPHLIAGPILRPTELMPQLAHPRRALDAPLALGLVIFTAGLVKKLVFADQIGAVVDPVYTSAAVPSGPAAVLALYGFAAQIYCDFSGYVDMAIGVALAIGIRLPNNFLRPYTSGSLVEFWRRWHITLSFWLRDYLYIPLGGNRRGRLRETFNIIVTMLLGGLWHGASWTFVIWGLLHGIGITLVHLTRRLLGHGRPGASGRVIGLPTWVAALLTFHVVAVLWVFFRAPTFAKALEVLSAPFRGGWGDAATVFGDNGGVLLLLGIFYALHRFDDHRRFRLALRRVNPGIVWPVVAMMWLLAITLSQGSSAKFIYFDF